MGLNSIPFELDVQMFLRLLIAVVLGALVGYKRSSPVDERERAGKPAGVRTHGMVSLGAALFAVVSIHGFGGTGDPARVAAQIVTGIGFLGAGAILHQRSNVHGLTTAASLWVTAAIGLAVGVGMIFTPAPGAGAGVSLATAVLVFLLLRFGTRPRLKDSDREAE